ncbi:hypothetical protein OSSY52_03970 [Tepiditoga spiralis]|uniref:Outer membrane protein beta-barrel domain-containing protein n=1 Tax=Tepiditoga spiralis TaxID=2108365 RepID=A0A7G1G4U6_9BACT|nr:hypothetical protein [Tepiditoga spiralis]BBE30256.1 hypothetical protein OSSY52_03970 [Tepiditoga spiralis]
MLKKMLVFWALIFVTIAFSNYYPSICSDSSILEEGKAEITISYPLNSIRMGLFGIAEVGISTSENGFYLKLGMNDSKIFPIDFNIGYSVIWNYTYNYFMHIGIPINTFKFQFGASYGKDIGIIDNYIIDNYKGTMSFSYLFDEDEKNQKFLILDGFMLEKYKGSNLDDTKFNVNLYGVEKFKSDFLFFKGISLIGGFQINENTFMENTIFPLSIVIGISTSFSLY